MFITLNDWKGIVVDIDAIPEEWDSKWELLPEIGKKKILLCGINKERLKKIKSNGEALLISEETPFEPLLFYHTAYAHILELLGSKSAQTVVITGSRGALKQAQNCGISSIFYCKEEEIPAELITMLPDHIAQSWEDIEKIIGQECAGYLAERRVQRYANQQKDQDTLMRTIQTELEIDETHTCPLIAAGRYFSQNDPRAYGHQLSKRVLLHKWEDTAQTEIFTEIYREIIKSAAWESIDAITRIPPKDSRQFDRFAEITKAIAADTSAEDLSDSLICVKKYGSQRTLNRAEREANVQGAFEMKKRVDGKQIVLLDDILTSGSTAQEAAKQLYVAGAKKVTVVVLAIKQDINRFLEDALLPIRCRKCGGEMQLRINRTTQEAFFGCRELYNKEAPCTYIESYQKGLERRNLDAGFFHEQEDRYLF